MNTLAPAAREPGLDAQVSPCGGWMRFRAPQGTIYVLKARCGDGYYMWSEPPIAPIAEFYPGWVEAVEAGLRRAGAAAGAPRGRTPIAVTTPANLAWLAQREGSSVEGRIAGPIATV